MIANTMYAIFGNAADWAISKHEETGPEGYSLTSEI